ncbi:hypothetical protein ElyMa_002871000 [Elysia marginata]|uniref:Uncharacterized protein n=1 Tax=Elysia marginata TaxID=1093978 RepID=A0AAV4I0M1_9GAST|nr:hypothetical protein ElyMa_002871000 [Elysia marginata]
MSRCGGLTRLCTMPDREIRQFGSIDVMRYGPAKAQEDETHSGGIPRWLMGLRGASANRLLLKSTLPMGGITSYVIVVGS